MSQAFRTLYKCPKCSAQIVSVDYVSGNTFGSKRYSDTYLDAPMGIPAWSSYLGCSNCDAVFVNSEDKKVKRPENETSEEWVKKEMSAAKPAPTLETIKRLLLNPTNIEKLPSRQTLLFWYLWCYNDYSRNKYKLTDENLSEGLNESFVKGLEMLDSEKSNGNYKKYLDELIELLTIERGNLNSSLLIAEIMREKGDFDQALAYLEANIYSQKDLDEKIRMIADEIKLRASNNKSETFEIK